MFVCIYKKNEERMECRTVLVLHFLVNGRIACLQVLKSINEVVDHSERCQHLAGGWYDHL